MSSPKKQAHIGTFYNAPPYNRDNESITHGYRINFNSPKKILKSMFMVHNQTTNIWTHLLGAVAAIITIIIFLCVVDGRFSIDRYREDFDKSVNHVSEILANMSQFAQASLNVEEFKLMAADGYALVEKTFNAGISQLNRMADQGLEKTVVELTKQGLNKLQRVKIEYEKVLIPAVLNELNYRIDSTEYIKSLKPHILEWKKLLDSEKFSYLDGPQTTPNPNEISRWPIVVFLICATLCLGFSAVFHLFSAMSPKVFTILLRLDYAGITILISGSAFAFLYYTLYCSMDLTSISSLVLFFLSLTDWFHRNQNKAIKGLLFGGLSTASVIVPIVHMTINELIYDNFGDSFRSHRCVPFYFLIALSYLVGLYSYSVRCPERYYPGKFNICGHSHSILHIGVIFGVLFTYMGLLTCLQIRKVAVCPVSHG